MEMIWHEYTEKAELTNSHSNNLDKKTRVYIRSFLGSYYIS